MSPAIEGVLIALTPVVVVLAVAGAVASARRADRAVASARRAERAARAAARHTEGLIELLADLSPSARRSWLAAREYRSPAIALAHRRLAQQHGHRTKPRKGSR